MTVCERRYKAYTKIKNMYVRPKALLLDVDGVVYRNHKVLNKVATNIVQYVAKELHMTQSDAERTNQLLYRSFGHTYLGMRALFDFDKDIHHFTQNVYTNCLLNEIENDSTTVADSVSVRCISEECRRKDIDLYLFSNAPSTWCNKVLNVMHLTQYVKKDNIISCDHDVFQSGLKPDSRVYETMVRYLLHQKHDDDLLCTFVDDSFINLLPVNGDPRWQPVFFGAPYGSFKNIMTIRDLSDLCTNL